MPSLRPALERFDLDRLPIKLLVRGIQTQGDELDTARLYNWLSVGTFRGWEGIRFPDESNDQVRSWLEERPNVQKALLLEGLRRCPDSDEFMFCSSSVWYSLYESAFPADFGLWCLENAVSLADTLPRVSEYLLQFAVTPPNQQADTKNLSRSVLIERTRGHKNLERQLSVMLNPPVIPESAKVRSEIEIREEDKRRPRNGSVTSGPCQRIT